MALCCATAVCLVLVLIVRDPTNEMAATVLTTFVKFCISITFFGVNLQSIEIYPTCLRQTGMAVGTIAATIFGIVGPYVVHLGTEYDVRYPFLVMGLSSAVGILAALFLPETLHQSLPNTIEEAQKFGKNQRFWSLPKAPQVTREADSNTDKRHDGSDAKPEESIRLTVPIEAEEARPPLPLAGPDERLLLLTPESLDFSLSAPPLLPPVTPPPPTITMPPLPSLPPPPSKPPFFAIVLLFIVLDEPRSVVPL
uniref:Major facilitator superfamily (MFS) profile domain-containing protein n=1 Tax=Anopheles coluzzii TaxID=1518534 RepID=A0A8W7PLX5_ANOCL